MSTRPILEDLESYQSLWHAGNLTYSSFVQKEELDNLTRLREFVCQAAKPFHRENLEGHVTGSALVVNNSFTKVLLTHHRKLDKWLQLGGHADGEHQIEKVALKEALEESGLKKLKLLDPISLILKNSHARPLPFDIDIHKIPARKQEPAHYHYDLRYLVMAEEDETVKVSEESHDVKWWSLNEARPLNNERSMLRQYHKLEALRPFHLKD